MLISHIELMIAAEYRSSKRKKQVRIIVIALLSFGMALLGLCLMLYVLKKKPKREGNTCKNAKIRFDQWKIVLKGRMTNLTTAIPNQSYFIFWILISCPTSSWQSFIGCFCFLYHVLDQSVRITLCQWVPLWNALTGIIYLKCSMGF